MKTVSLRTTLKALLCSALVIPLSWQASAMAADDKAARGQWAHKTMSQEARAEHRAAWREQREAHWAGREAELREANPALAAELDALRAQREQEGPAALRRMDRDTFRETYPELHQTIEQGQWAQRLSGRGPMMHGRPAGGRHHRGR